MKKPTVLTFFIWNPLKEFYLCFEFKTKSNDERADCYLLFAFVFFQLEINFRLMYLTIKNFLNERIR